MATMKLYSGPLSLFGAKAQIALLEKGVEFELEMVPFGLAGRYTPKHPEVQRINPKAQVPVLCDGALELFDSTQIFEYLEDRVPEPRLWPRSPEARARARLLELLADEVFFPHLATLMNPAARGDPNAVAAASEAIRKSQAELDERLDGREYLTGDYGYADVAWFMAQYFAAFLGAPFAPSLSSLAAWWRRVGTRPAVRAVIDPMSAELRAYGLADPESLAVSPARTSEAASRSPSPSSSGSP
jgi:glutathione S-transferase